MKKIIIAIYITCFSLVIQAQTTILNVDFQNGIPSNFTLVDNDNNIPNEMVAEFTNAWISYQDPDSTENMVAASTSYFTPIDTASRWLITPPIQLGAFGNFFSWNAKSHDPSFPDNYLVLVSTTDSLITSFTDTIGSVEQENFEWTNREVNLSSKGYNNQQLFVAFVNTTFDGFKLYIDDIHARKEDPVGVNELSSIQATIYPNPFQEQISITSQSEISSVQIIDLNGKIIHQTNQTNIQLSNLEKGTYFVKIISGNSSAVKKIQKF